MEPMGKTLTAKGCPDSTDGLVEWRSLTTQGAPPPGKKVSRACITVSDLILHYLILSYSV